MCAQTICQIILNNEKILKNHQEKNYKEKSVMVVENVP